MKYQKYIWSFILLLLGGSVWLDGQEKLVGLEDNPQIIRLLGKKMVDHKSLIVPDTLELPFFDDFSRASIFPNMQKWQDKEVFVNFDYGTDPPSVGVATFDVLDASGHIYDHATTFSFVADHLTSRPVNLDLPVDSGVFLSFYYQPKGNGDPPQVKDSLKLEFYSPLDTAWVPVWSVPGDTLPPDSLQTFKQIMIPIDEPKFLKKGFQFRFLNLASLSNYKDDPGRITNCDHWNIDYVMLDKNRFPDDTIPHDVMISKPLKSLVKNFEAMPWKQFKKVYLSEMGSFLPLVYSNLDTITRNVTRNFEIFDMYQNVLAHSYSGGAFNIGPWETIVYPSQPLYTFQSPGEDSALFRIKAILITDIFDQKENDTITYDQHFDNYFAYDDGTAEAGYGYSGEGASNVNIACGFKSFVTDTLKAVDIFFNRSCQNANDTYFHLTIWNDMDGLPGDILYAEEYVKPSYTDSLNAFYRYRLKTPVIVNGPFYVGWQQTTDVFMNVGFDKNRESSQHLMYQLNGEWLPTKWKGTLMIRPVTGSFLLVSTKEKPLEVIFKVFPNPTDRILQLDLGSLIPSSDFSIKIYNLLGEVLIHFSRPLSQINVSSLAPGLYFIEVHNAGYTRKIKFLKIPG